MKNPLADMQIAMMRGMIADARKTYWEQAERIVAKYPDLRPLAEKFAAAIGEVSPREALVALHREAEKTRRHS